MQERMAHYTAPADGNGCRLWIGGVNKSGYGTVASGGTGGASLMAHRVAYKLAGHALDHRPIHHKCANKLCVEPEHLTAVDPHENTAEMFERKWFLKRIAALEAALNEVAPGHPLVAPANS